MRLIGDDDVGVLSDATDHLQVIAGPRRRLAAVFGSLGGRFLLEIRSDIRALRAGEIALRVSPVLIQVDLSALLQRQALGNLVGELIEIRVVLVEVLCDGAVKVVRHVLADLGVSGVVLLAVGIAHDLLLDGGDARFLGDINGRVTHNSEDGRRARLADSDGVSFGHKEPVTVRETRGSTIIRCLFVSKAIYGSSNLICSGIKCHAAALIAHFFRDPVRGVLGGLSRIGVVLFFDNTLDGLLHAIVCPSDVGNFTAVNISLKNLITLELGSVALNVLDSHQAVRLRSKRHGHRRHNPTEAQRCCEAGGYCQACDVLAHAHLLFLCFLLEFHLI